MATTVFLLNTTATTHRGTNTAKLDGTTSGWAPRGTGTARGSGLAVVQSNTVTGATNGVEVGQATLGFPVEWLTPPVDADVTISGTITANVWAEEGNMSANVAINVVIDKVAATDQAITQIVKSTRVTELPVGTRAALNFTTGMTAADYTDVSLNKGDRLRIRVFGDDAGTMATGFLFSAGYNGTTGAADGDTFITFTETFDFQTTDPTTTTIYLTDTASDVATSDVDREAWTSRGGGVANDVRNTATGYTAPLQVTDTAGGTAVSWFTKQLQAFTLGGLVKVNLRANASNAAANASVGVEIARVDSDGTNPTVWGYANRDAATTNGQAGEISTSEAAYTVYVAGDDLAFTDGQRVRVRLFVDDCGDAALVTGHTVTTYYNGTSGGASGDTFLIFGQTLTEFTGGGGASKTPDTIARSFTVPAAEARAASSITPATIDRSIAVPQATGGASASVTPATIARSFTVPQATPTSSRITESFNKADSDVLGPDLTWTEVTGDLDVASNEARGTGSLSRGRAEVVLNSSDMYVRAEVTVSEDTNFARTNLGARMSEGTNAELDMYAFQQDFQNNQVRFFRTIDGTSTEIALGSFTFTAATYYTALFILQGSNLKGFIDDVLVLEFNDTSPPGGFAPGVKAGIAIQKTITGFGAVDEFEAGTNIVFDQSKTPAAIARSVAVDQVTISASASVTPATIARSLTVDQVSAGAATTQTPATIARSFVMDQAAPSAGSSLTPTTLARSFVIDAVTISAGVSLTPATVARVFVMDQASAGAATSVAPAVIARAFVMDAVDERAGSTLTPAVIARAFVIDQASPQTAGNATVSPSLIARAFTMDAAEARAGSATTPAVIARAFVLPAAGVSAGVSITPGVIARLFVIPQVTVLAGGGATITPDTIERAFTIPQAGISASSSLTPATIARAFALAQAAATGGTGVTPATIARSFALAQAATTTEAAPTPSTLALIVVVPAATALGNVGPDILTIFGPSVTGSPSGAVLVGTRDGEATAGVPSGSVAVVTRNGPS